LHSLDQALAGADGTPGLPIRTGLEVYGRWETGKSTLAVRFGRGFAQCEYIGSILFAAAIPVYLYLITKEHFKIVFVSSIILIAIPSIQVILTKTDGPSLNKVLGFTGKLLIIYSILFSLGWIL